MTASNNSNRNHHISIYLFFLCTHPPKTDVIMVITYYRVSMDAHLEAELNTVCSTSRCDDSLTKQINVARTGRVRDEVTGCAHSVTLPSAGISLPEDKNTVLCHCFCTGSSLESGCHRKLRRWSKRSIFLILNKSLLSQCKRTCNCRQIIAGCAEKPGVRLLLVELVSSH